MNKKNPFSKLKIAIVLKLDTNLDIHVLSPYEKLEHTKWEIRIHKSQNS
jgi:hypothetical protein